MTSTSFMLSRDWRVDLNLSTIARRRVNKAPASLSGWNALLHRVSLSSSCQRLTFQPSPAFGCDLPSSFVKSAQKCFWRTFSSCFSFETERYFLLWLQVATRNYLFVQKTAHVQILEDANKEKKTNPEDIISLLICTSLLRIHFIQITC